MVLTLAALSFAGCGSTTGTSADMTTETTAATGGKTTITLGYLPITHALALFEEKELLDEADSDIQIDLQKFGSWTDLMDALNAGKIDGASVLIELAMNSAAQGIDLKAVALGHRDGNVIVVADDIKDTSDLVGKSFAIPSNQSSHNILLNDMLSESGISPDEVNIVQMSPSEMPSSLASGSISGYCVAEPFGAQAIVQNIGHVLYDSTELWENSICCAFVLNNRFITKNPDATDELIAQYYAAGKALTSEKATEIATKYLGQDETILTESLQWIQYDDLEITREDYTLLTDKMKTYGISDAPVSYEDFVYIPK